MTELTLAERVAAASGTTSAPATPRHLDVAVWRTATEADIDAIHGVLVAADAVDHPTWSTPREEVVENFEVSHVDHARDTMIAFAADGTAVATGTTMRHPSVDEHVHVYANGAVHPQWRGRGIGRALFGWQHARAEEQLREIGATGEVAALDAAVHVYAGERDLAIAAVAEALGYRTERWFSTMVRDLVGDDAPPLPDAPEAAGIEFVPFTADRAEDARLARNDAFRDHWGSLPSPSERWQQFVGGAFFRPDLSTLALDEGRIVAFCLASVNEGDFAVLGPNAYIDLIGVVRSHRRRGLAPRAIAHTLRAIRDAGLGKAVLDVDTESPTGANALYGGLGFAATERDRVLVRRY